VHVPARVTLDTSDFVLVLRDDDVLRIRLALGAVSLDLGPYRLSRFTEGADFPETLIL